MRKHLRFKAWILLLVFLTETFAPLQSFALTSGPSQPEMASFTPAGTTELVDPFTGDFSYNIPLMDVEGYPINIAYNSGVSMEQEASWVGLGWNLNVGSVNRSVRGLPDDFKGDTDPLKSDEIETYTTIKPMKIIKVGGGVGAEFLGDASIFGFNAGADFSFVYNNYKGIGLERGVSMGPSLGVGILKADASVGYTMSTLDGTTLNSSLGVKLNVQNSAGKGFSFGGNVGSGYNTRTGQTMLSLGTTAGYSQSKGQGDNRKTGSKSLSGSATFLPIGMETYTPYPAYELTSTTTAYSGSIGGEVYGLHANANLHGSKTTQQIENKTIVKEAYGYLYSEKAGTKDLMDFNRDKQVQLNKTIANLSPTSFTYDVYSVSGQGVAGTFRPFRNDIGKLNDPLLGSAPGSRSSKLGAEVGLGNIFHAGVNSTVTSVSSDYTPWYGGAHSGYKFKEEKLNKSFEKVYFKAAGELTETDLDYFNNELQGTEAIAFQLDRMNTNPYLITSSGNTVAAFGDKPVQKRQARAKLLSFYTAEEASLIHNSGLLSWKGSDFYSVEYDKGNGHIGLEEINRVSNDRKPHHIGEIIQTNPNGDRYIFGIPAYNFEKREVTYNTAATAPNASITINGNNYTLGRVAHNSTEDSPDNSVGLDHYYNYSHTPAYAHSYLLTGKTSHDYQDLGGDGITADDIGNAWSFNYVRKSSDYHWRIPYSNANLIKGFERKNADQKASYTEGTKELWYVHSIESKNQVAEFELEARDDALGASSASKGGLPGNYEGQESFLLKKITLYNKQDRINLGADAVPVKTVEFFYDYSLCKGVENNKKAATEDVGKLTLKSIEISYGNSAQGKLSPYKFTYSSENPNYNPLEMDRWGNYKEGAGNPGAMANEEFPYATQDRTDADTWASAWNLTEIITPNGGKISVSYEADDYAYVQNKRAMQMMKVIGFGNSKTSSSTANTVRGNTIIYLDVPTTGLNISQGEPERIRELFFGGEDQLQSLYFRMPLNIRSSNDYEYVSGYVRAIDVGLTNDGKIWVELESNEAITQTAWGFFRQNLFDYLYDQPNILDDEGVEALVKGIKANIEDIMRMFKGVEEDLRDKKVAFYADLSRAFIRLYNPTRSKLGGGSRVKEVTLSDQWGEMAADAASATYGQTYEYTTTDDLGNTISSGVATYEPFIGNDENPWRTPVPYIAQAANGHIPAIDAYQETPFGETFFPGASVGYSKVTVKSIHYGVGRTSNTITEQKFYTAKDFPVIVKATSLGGSQKHNAPSTKAAIAFPFVGTERKSEFAASQGYSIILNDMHGKPLSTRTYTLQEVGGTLVEKEVGGTRYTYSTKKTEKGLELDNEVKVISGEGKLEDKLLGVEYDLVIDNSRAYDVSQTATTMATVDAFPIPGTPIPFYLPMAFANVSREIKESRTVVLTKVIQMYGIIQSIENYTDQYATTVYNRVYDGLTGEVLLTETQDEHKKEEFQFKVPARITSGKQRMGGAYENDGFVQEILYETNGDACYEVDGNGDHKGTTFYNREDALFKHGDQVLVYPQDGSPYTAWVDVNFNNFNTGVPVGKDPVVPAIADENCYNTWILQLQNDQFPAHAFCDNISPNLPDVYDAYLRTTPSRLSSGDIEFYLPKQDMIDFMLKPYDIDGNWSGTPTQGNIDDAFCSLVNSPEGNLFYNQEYSMPCGYTNIDSDPMGLLSMFDLGTPIAAELIDNDELSPRISISGTALVNNENLEALLNNSPTKKPGGLSALFLLKMPIELVPGEDPVNIYAVYSYYRYVNALYAASENPTIVNTTMKDPISNQLFTCPLSYRLLDRTGAVIATAQEGDLVKVVRSGNRNLLNYYEGSVTATSDPIDVDSEGNFRGVKSPAEIEILQIEAQEYADEYTIESTRSDLGLNKFLSGEDGCFRVLRTHKFIAPRYQNSGEVETAKDGYIETILPLWNRPELCYDVFGAPYAFNSTDWFVQEEITKWTESGASLEAQNNELDLYSSVLLCPHGQTEATASNTKQKDIAVESFENYRQLDYVLHAWEPHFSMLSGASLDHNTVGRTQYLTTPLTTLHEQLLVKGVAHTGDYSIYLKGANPNAETTVDYTEKPLSSLAGRSIGTPASATPISKTLSSISYPTAQEQMLSDFAVTYGSGSDIYNEIIAASGNFNGANTLNYHFVPGSGQNWQPQSGNYYFSVWVKEALDSDVPYKGVSPKVQVSAGSGLKEFSINSKEINGWYQITGEFTYSGGGNIDFTLNGGLFGAFFDDLRIHPAESNMKTYVYDEENGRLKAQLDENNYATYYDYDEEGIPYQLRRETASGVLTVSESRQFKHQHPNP